MKKLASVEVVWQFREKLSLIFSSVSYYSIVTSFSSLARGRHMLVLTREKQKREGCVRALNAHHPPFSLSFHFFSHLFFKLFCLTPFCFSNVREIIAMEKVATFGVRPRMCLVKRFIRCFSTFWLDFGCISTELLDFFRRWPEPFFHSLYVRHLR